MSHYSSNANQINGTLVSVVIIINFLVIGGFILASSPEASARVGQVVAMSQPTETPTFTETPLPTATPTLTNTPLPPTATEVSATTGQTGGLSTVSEYDPALVVEGQGLFTLCSACHGPDARGLPNLGKNLVESEFVHSQSDADLLNFIKTGRPMWDPLNTTGIDMPPKGGNPALSDENILAIIAYIRSLSADGGQSSQPADSSTGDTTVPVGTTAYDPALVAEGQGLFTLCSACHGPDARGLPNLGKDLVTSEFVHSLSDEELLIFIKTGRPIWDALNTTGIDMPPKGGNPALTDENILAIIAYIRSLSANNP